MLNISLSGKVAGLIAGAMALVLVSGPAHAASDLETCFATDTPVEALDRIGACSRALDGGLSGEDLAKARFFRGVAYGQMAQTDLAIVDFTEALKSDGQNVDLWLARSQAHFQKRQHDLAMLDLAEAIKLKPDNAVAQDMMGKNHFMLGNFELAIKFFDKAIDLDSNFYNAYINRATTYYRENKLDMAMKDVNAAYLMLPPGDTRGRALLQLKAAIEQSFVSQQRARQTTN